MAANAKSQTFDAIEPDIPLPPADAASPGIDPLAPRAAVAIAIAVFALCALTWAIQILGLVLVWPILFVIPGWVLVARVAPNLPAPGRVGLAIVSSVYLSAHLVNLAARLDGFGRPAVLASAATLAVATVVLSRVHHPWLAPPARPTIAGFRAALVGYRPAWVTAAAIGLTVAGILGLNGWRQTPEGFVSGGSNWSDLLVHVSIGSSILHGNFPPEVPYFAGVPLTYHWFADFHGAIAASAAGVDIIPVYFASSALFAAVLGLLVWTLALTLTHRRMVATVATLLVCFGGGMGWIRLVADLIAGGNNPITLVTQNSYDNSWADGWPWFRIASVLGTGLLPHRATTLGLPGLVAAALLAVNFIGRRPAGVLLAGVLAALLAPFHFYAFPATYLIVFLFVIFSGTWRSPTVLRDAVLFLAPAVLAIPFVATAVLQQSDRGAFRFVLGWSEARFGDGPLAVAFFYVTNLGLPFILAGLAAVVGRRLPARGFMVAWVVMLFLIPNLVVVSAVEFDMNKYFQMMWVAVGILAAWIIRSWPRPAIAGVVLASALSPALVGLWYVWNPALVLTTQQVAAARWIEANTPDRSVFVTDAFINSPVDVAGRLRVSTFGPYAANLGYDPDPRGADIQAIYCNGSQEAASLMARYHATYVLSSGGALDCGHDPTDFSSSEEFETVYDANGMEIWHLRAG